jgi:hypothetical protein
MNMFDKDLGLDLLINRKKVGSDVASLVSGSGESGSVIDIDSDAGSIKSINIKPNVVDVREHMQPSRQRMGFNGRQNDYEEESEVYDSNSQSGSDGTGGTEEQSMQGYPTNNYNQQYNQQPQRRMMSEEEIINAKREILYQFERMERKGMQLPRKFTMASGLEEMRLELDRLKKDREIDQSVKFQRKVMMTVVTGAELLNNKFDPVGARLDGWSESINDNIDDYDEVFEELHDKYKGKAKMAPEFKLMFMLGGSAFMFHMTNTMFKTQMPGLDQVLKQNPELMRQFAAATASTMQQNTAESNPMMSGLSGMFSNMFGGNSGQQPSAPQRPPQPQYAPPQQASRPNMKGPSNVDDILREIERENMNDRVEMMSTITQSELSELGDDASINGLLMNKRGKGGKKGLNLDI